MFGRRPYKNESDPEMEVLRQEAETKTHWSYFWTAAAAAATAVTIGLAVHAGMLITAGTGIGLPIIGGFVMTVLAAVTAGFQALSLDEEVAMVRDKVEAHLVEKNRETEKDVDLASAITELRNEVHELREQNADNRRTDWRDNIREQRRELLTENFKPTIH
ncbi:MAG: hypothetical protein MRY32_02425 [Rickettsiales bacterium]|nr:hypothetical protein [Rickettsiales bacterium]